MTREYIATRNPNGFSVRAVNQAKEHYHVHLCVHGVEYRSGKVMRMGKGYTNKLKKHLEYYQCERYPQITHSRVEHGIRKRNRGSTK